MILQAAACILACAALGQADRERHTAADLPPGYVQSEVLGQALADLAADMVAQQVKDGQPVPESWKKPNFLPRVIAEYNRETPAVLRATAGKERKWKAGQFDEEAAQRRIDATLKLLADFGVEMPTITQYAITKHRTGQLKGAQLELTSRLLNAQLRKLIRTVSSDEGHGGLVAVDRAQFDSVQPPEEPASDVSLPAVAAEEEKPPLAISIAADGSLHLAGSPITTAQIQAFLTATGPHDGGLRVVIRADRETPFRFVVQLLDSLKEHGVESIHFSTEK